MDVLWFKDHESLNRELRALSEWNSILQQLLASQPANACQQGDTPRRIVENLIRNSTEGRVRIWWESPPTDELAAADRLADIRWGRIRYGLLGLTPGYLVSALLPGIPQRLANLCGLLLHLAEHEVFIDNQIARLPPGHCLASLTSREKDVLMGLARGETEEETATRLGITPSTVRFHRHNLYRHLDVCTEHDAVIRGLAVGLIHLADVPWRDGR